MTARLQASALACAIVTAVSIWTAWPGLSALDGGDFITAGTVLGVPHATGFPLEVQLTGVATLAPVGNLAWRCALVSALLSGVAAGLFTWLGGSLGRLRGGYWIVAAAVTVSFATVDTLAMHARVAEVYALNLALIGLALVGLERLSATGDLRWRAVVALACGLGLANHALFRLWFVPLVFASILIVPKDRRLRGMAGCVLVGTAALFAYAYLAVAAAADPPHNWGDPSTLDRWWAHVTARDIRAAFADEMMPGGIYLRVYVADLARQMWEGLTLLVPFGLMAAWIGRRWRLAVAVLCVVAIEVVYAVAINPMGLRDFQNGQLLAVFLALSGGVTLSLIVERTPAPARAPSAAAAIALVAAVWLIGGHRFGDTGTDWSFEDVVVAQLGLSAPESIIAPVSDSLTAGFLYAASGLSARPDAFVIGRYLLSDDVALSREVTDAPFEVVPNSKVAEWAAGDFGNTMERTVDILRHQINVRSIYWEPTGSGSELPAGLSLEHRWPMGEIVHEGEGGDECSPPERAWCGSGDVAFGAAARSDGYFYGRWAARQWAFVGARRFRAGDFDASGAAFREAASLNPEAGPWLTGVALSLANTGRLEEALSVQQQALRLSPLSARAFSNAALFADALGRSGLAESYRARAEELEVPR